VGNVLTQVLNGSTTTYTYDATNQLTGDGTSTHTYDGEGNRTNTGYSTGTGNQLQSDGTWNYTYDHEGNEIKKINISTGVTWLYGYDAKNELTQAQEWSADPALGGSPSEWAEADYKYDAFGNRLEMDNWNGVPTVWQDTRFAYDGWNPGTPAGQGTTNFEVWADLTSSNTLQTRYLRGDQIDQLFARVDMIGTTETPYWYLTDRQGSVRDVTDGSGNVKDTINYDGFGNIISDTNSNYRGRYAWTGRELDVETGLQYNRARYFDATAGRWISQDPLGLEAGDSNLYRYVKNMPDDSADPSGLQAVPATITTIAPVNFAAPRFPLFPNFFAMDPTNGTANYNQPGPFSDVTIGDFQYVVWLAIVGKNLSDLSITRTVAFTETLVGGRAPLLQLAPFPGGYLTNQPPNQWKPDNPGPQTLWPRRPASYLIIADAPGVPARVLQNNPLRLGWPPFVSGIDFKAKYHLCFSSIISGKQLATADYKVWIDAWRFPTRKWLVLTNKMFDFTANIAN
jgi:RHS repeat-associated protein